MAEIKTSDSISLLDTLKSFKQGECLTIPQESINLQKQSVRVKISQWKAGGLLPKEVSFSINEFDNPKRYLILRKK